MVSNDDDDEDNMLKPEANSIQMFSHGYPAKPGVTTQSQTGLAEQTSFSY